jgi:transcription-repair coupling factor (superfamily II helicase)
MYGISQLYQLRGRVGRSDRLAYAFLLYPEERALSEIAMKRLQVISDHTELGSGFQVALKDLEVRGAGNLLGRQQHGDILSVGFDMYVRMLDKAVAALSDEKRARPVDEVFLELEYSGYIPDEYIDEAAEKMEIYKKIAGITTEEELESLLATLEDRFGPIPDNVQSLLALAEIRILCGKLNISSLRERSGDIRIEFARIADLAIDRVMRLIRDSGGKIRPDPKHPNVLIIAAEDVGLAQKSEYLRERLVALL